ncbi:MAG: MOSC domain-containing protein [Lachnospiraceae bacterium]|nr:MOSC domain-containing protein [Lachnospiraceae bacterium]
MTTAKVHSICICQERGQLKKEIPEALFIENFGIQGDGHGGDWGRQVTCLSWDSVEKSNEERGLSMGPGDFAENVAIEGMDALDLQAGDRFRLGESAVLEVTQIGKPDHPSVVTRTFGVSLLPYEGRFCRVIQGGSVKPGDLVEKL